MRTLASAAGFLFLSAIGGNVAAKDVLVPPPTVIDHNKDGHTWRDFIYDMPSDAFRFRKPTAADWNFIWSGYGSLQVEPLTVKYQCFIDDFGRYVASRTPCRASCPGATRERLCVQVGQRYFDKFFDDLADMPKNENPTLVGRRFVSFQLNFDPKMRPVVDFGSGSEIAFNDAIKNHKDVATYAVKLIPRDVRYEGGEYALKIQCKIMDDRSVACRAVDTPMATLTRLEGLAEGFGLVARPVAKLPDGRAPVGMRFTQNVRFKIPSSN